jgi:hypothetical protein
VRMITREEFRVWIKENLTRLGPIAEEGYVKSGRGAVLVHFNSKPVLVAVVLFVNSEDLKRSLSDSEHQFHIKVVELVETYEPDNQMVAVVMLDRRFYTLGLIQFET